MNFRGLLIAIAFFLQILPVFALDTVDGASPAAQQIDFKHLLVFSAGLHKFKDNYLHPGKEAVVGVDINLMKVLQARGVPDNQLMFLRDEEATRDNCRNGLHQLLSRSNAGDVLFFFMHSHGGDGVICTYQQKEGWKYEDLIQEIEDNFRGRNAIICVAACHSGSFIDAVKSAPRKVSYFVLTTVHPDKNAWTIATSDFEACLTDSFSGAPCPDLNQDGVITVEEFAQYVSRDQSTLFASRPDFAFVNGFQKNMIISNAAPRCGPWQCCLVCTKGGFRGRIMKQDGDRLLLRPRMYPERLYPSSPDRVRLMD